MWCKRDLWVLVFSSSLLLSSTSCSAPPDIPRCWRHAKSWNCHENMTYLYKSDWTGMHPVIWETKYILTQYLILIYAFNIVTSYCKNNWWLDARDYVTGWYPFVLHSFYPACCIIYVTSADYLAIFNKSVINQQNVLPLVFAQYVFYVLEWVHQWFCRRSLF